MNRAPSLSHDDLVVAEQRAIVSQLAQSVTVVRRRVRLTAGLRVVAKVLPWLLLPLSLAVALIVAGWVPRWSLGLLLPTVVGALSVYAWAASRRVSRMSAALTIDRHLGCEGRFAAAYEFSHSSRVDGYQQLVVNEAKTLFPLQLKDVARVSAPAEMGWTAGVAAVLVALTFIPHPPPQLVPPTARGSVEPPREKALSADDAELLQRRADELKAQIKSAEATRLLAEYNDLILKLSDGTLSQAEGFRLAAELSAQVAEEGKQAAELAEGLVARGEVLRQKRATQGVGQALAERRFADAAQALEKLAERLSAGTLGLSERELDELRASLEQLRKEQEEPISDSKPEQAAADEEKTRAELERTQSELAAKRDRGQATADDLKRLSETERQLKRLSRAQKPAPDKAQQQLSELDRKLLDAARALQEERKKSGEFLQQAAQQVGEQSARQLTDEEKRALIEQLEALKERLRQQNQSGGQQQRMRDFQRRARGQSSQPGEGPPDGQQSGDGRPGSDMPFDVRLGPGEAPLPSSQQNSQQQPGVDGEQVRGQGQTAGHSHDPNLTGDASRLAHQAYDDKAAAGQDSGTGPSASETIATAAERGFTAGSYQKLYHEYQTVAEEIMDKDRVPSGRRTHVRRYFDLIRPRGETSNPKSE